MITCPRLGPRFNHLDTYNASPWNVRPFVMFDSAYSTSCSIGTLPLRLFAVTNVPRGSGLALLSSVFSRELKSLVGEFLSKLFLWE